jgi:hypothetical protein
VAPAVFNFIAQTPISAVTLEQHFPGSGVEMDVDAAIATQ